MRIEHAIRGTIRAPRADVWALVGAFEDQSWNPGVRSCDLVDEEGAARVGSIRRMQTTEGSTIFERLEGVDPGRSLAYSFAGSPPVPVLTSRNTITLSDPHGPAGASTDITWSGAYDVLGDDDRRAVEHVNLRVVWPASIGALAAALGAEHSLDAPAQTPTPKGGNDS